MRSLLWWVIAGGCLGAVAGLAVGMAGAQFVPRVGRGLIAGCVVIEATEGCRAGLIARRWWVARRDEEGVTGEPGT